jgi:hypothetical protein
MKREAEKLCLLCGEKVASFCQDCSHPSFMEGIEEADRRAAEMERKILTITKRQELHEEEARKYWAEGELAKEKTVDEQFKIIDELMDRLSKMTNLVNYCVRLCKDDKIPLLEREQMIEFLVGTFGEEGEGS